MSKVNILNLILLIAVIILGFIIYDSETENNLLDTLTTIDTNEIQSISILHNNNKISLNKNSNNQWKISQPLIIEANNFRINSLLELLNAPVHAQYSTNEIDTSAIGLSNPSTSISFNKKTISFGITNPVTNLRYIQMNDTIYTIQDVYYPLISSNIGTLISFNLLSSDSTIGKLILKNQTISKNNKNLWQSNNRLTADNINKTIDHWLNDQAFGVHNYLRREELGEVFIYLSNEKEPVTFLITDTVPWLILARPELGIEYHLDKKAYNNLIAPTN